MIDFEEYIASLPRWERIAVRVAGMWLSLLLVFWRVRAHLRKIAHDDGV